MKRVEKSAPVEIAMRTLDHDALDQVREWISQLENWDDDDHLRRISRPLDGFPGVYVLRASSDMRIFFRVEGDTVTILDIARTPAIIASGTISGAR